MKFLLFPFSLLYGLGTFVRNQLYDWGVFSSTKFSLPIISVGNLSTGGTGKTPVVVYLANLLKDRAKLASLSRGYGRKSKGFLVANYSSTAIELGDEPLLFFNRFKTKMLVCVCEDRVLGVQKILERFKPSLILLDDAFQHRAISSSFSILLTPFKAPYFQDSLLPYGNLREAKSSAKRASVIVVTKCPTDLSEEQKQEYVKKINPTQNQKVFFSSILYSNQIYGKFGTLQTHEIKDYHVLCVSGIAHSKDFERFIKEKALSFTEKSFPDHYNYTTQDIETILSEFKLLPSPKIILTTEKDYMRLNEYKSLDDKLYFLPIDLDIQPKEEFDSLILSQVP
ncbi:MAG: tetraacyldisaccharide 4'-kinase [Flavobacteriaceae bacterium]|nr:MAG: tetraacyldisaccharide 4'-kinase [Flavobacteriaceae bacterium]